MAEWSNALVLKTSVQQCTGGSNPSFSAQGDFKHLLLFQITETQRFTKGTVFKTVPFLHTPVSI